MLRGTGIEARWERLIREVFPDGQILRSIGINDYQGHEVIVVRFDDGYWMHYSWSYGSCSGCDVWEDMDPEERRKDILASTMKMDPDHMADYLVMNWDSSWLQPLKEDAWETEEVVGMTKEELLERLSLEQKNSFPMPPLDGAPISAPNFIPKVTDMKEKQ